MPSRLVFWELTEDLMDFFNVFLTTILSENAQLEMSLAFPLKIPLIFLVKK